MLILYIIVGPAAGVLVFFLLFSAKGMTFWFSVGVAWLAGVVAVAATVALVTLLRRTRARRERLSARKNSAISR